MLLSISKPYGFHIFLRVAESSAGVSVSLLYYLKDEGEVLDQIRESFESLERYN